MNLKEFHELFLKKDAISLITSHEMRELCNKFALILSKTINITNSVNENSNPLEKLLGENLKPRGNVRRKTKKKSN